MNGKVRIQLMQVYSQKSTRTTLPRSASAVSGAEFTQRSGLNAGSLFAAPAKLEPTTMPAKRNKRMALMRWHSSLRHWRSKSVHVDNRDGEGPRGFLRQVMSNSASQVPVYVSAGELRGVSSRGCVRRAVGIPFKRDCGHGDDRTGR